MIKCGSPLNDTELTIREKCPVCLHAPESWIERPEHGSRELVWIGCRKDGLLVGGLSFNIALQNWRRTAAKKSHELSLEK